MNDKDLINLGHKLFDNHLKIKNLDLSRNFITDKGFYPFMLSLS
jgi:hypothetical protein